MLKYNSFKWTSLSSPIHNSILIVFSTLINYSSSSHSTWSHNNTVQHSPLLKPLDEVCHNVLQIITAIYISKLSISPQPCDNHRSHSQHLSYGLRSFQIGLPSPLFALTKETFLGQQPQQSRLVSCSPLWLGQNLTSVNSVFLSRSSDMIWLLLGALVTLHAALLFIPLYNAWPPKALFLLLEITDHAC